MLFETILFRYMTFFYKCFDTIRIKSSSVSSRRRDLEERWQIGDNNTSNFNTMKTVKYLKESGLLIKGARKALEKETKEQKG